MSIAVILNVRVDYLFIPYLSSGINGPSLLLVISLDVDCLNQRHVKSTICLFSGERLDAKIIIAQIVDNFFHLCNCLYLTLCPIFRCLIGCILHKSYCSRHELNNTNFFFVLCGFTVQTCQAESILMSSHLYILVAPLFSCSYKLCIMPTGSMGRQHIHVATLVHQFPYHIFFTICIFTYVTCIILSIVIHVWTLKIKYLIYLPGTKSSAWMIPVCGPGPSSSMCMHGSTCVHTMASH